MCDKIPMPSVKTSIKVGNFTLNVFAYRHLTKAECRIVVSKYKADNHIKKLPSSGSVNYFTIIGYNPEDGI